MPISPSVGGHGSPSTSHKIDDLEFWNCYTCRKRKIRCNRRSPCSNCQKSGLSCTFPVSGRVPTRRSASTQSRSSTSRQSELLKKLSHLENAVENLSEKCDILEGDKILNPKPCARPIERDVEVLGAAVATKVTVNGGNMYVDNGFWTSLHSEADRLFGMVQNAAEAGSTPRRFFAPDPLQRPLFALDDQYSRGSWSPLPSQMRFIWQVFKERIDPCIKVLHRPSIATILEDCQGNIGTLDIQKKALFYSIALAAVESLDEDEVFTNFNRDKSVLMAGLAYVTEKALVDAGLFSTDDLTLLQAAVIFLDCFGPHYGPKTIWNVVGLLTRTALSMGLHRDSAHFSNIKPFESEMRRRVWWCICFLDLRFGDAQPINMAITENVFDTLEPTNINDEDIEEGMMKVPQARDGVTDMTFCLLRCELWRLIRRAYSYLYSSQNETRTSLDVEISMLKQTKHIEDRILRHLDASKPLHILIGSLARNNLARSEMLLKHGSSIGNRKSAGDEATRDRAFDSALANLEAIEELQNAPETRHWSWIFRGCVPWDSLGILSTQLLGVEEWTDRRERAWKAVMRGVNRIPPSVKAEEVRQPIWHVMEVVASQRHDMLLRRSFNECCF